MRIKGGVVKFPGGRTGGDRCPFTPARARILPLRWIRRAARDGRPTALILKVGRASVPAAFGSAGFQPVYRTGKMPAPPRTFQNSRAWAFGPPANHEELVLAGGTAFPGCARLTCFLGTGWKACATNLKNFSRTVSRNCLTRRWFFTAYCLLLTAHCSLADPPNTSFSPNIRIKYPHDTAGSSISGENHPGHD